MSCQAVVTGIQFNSHDTCFLCVWSQLRAHDVLVHINNTSQHLLQEASTVLSRIVAPGAKT